MICVIRGPPPDLSREIARNLAFLDRRAAELGEADTRVAYLRTLGRRSAGRPPNEEDEEERRRALEALARMYANYCAVVGKH